jgi:methionyl-tRNA formyltransferase
MKAIFMGTPEFAVPCLDAMIKEKFELLAVFTQPDKPKGRGKKIMTPPVKELAVSNKIPVFQPSNLKGSESLELIKKINPDIIVVVAYGHILPKSILELPPFGCINVHASLLPKYRGAAPINWAIINGEEKTGITTMYMDAGLDTGDMILAEELVIGSDETAEELQARMSALGAEVLIKTLGFVETGNVVRVQQKNEESSYAPMMSKELGRIDWQKPASEIRNLVRGTIPWPTAFTTYKGQPMKIFKCREHVTDKACEAGKIISVARDEIVVGTGLNMIGIQELQFSGGKRLSVKDFLVGNHFEEGVILGEDDRLE